MTESYRQRLYQAERLQGEQKELQDQIKQLNEEIGTLRTPDWARDRVQHSKFSQWFAAQDIEPLSEEADVAYDAWCGCRDYWAPHLSTDRRIDLANGEYRHDGFEGQLQVMMMPKEGEQGEYVPVLDMDDWRLVPYQHHHPDSENVKRFLHVQGKTIESPTARRFLTELGDYWETPWPAREEHDFPVTTLLRVTLKFGDMILNRALCFWKTPPFKPREDSRMFEDLELSLWFRRWQEV